MEKVKEPIQRYDDLLLREMEQALTISQKNSKIDRPFQFILGFSLFVFICFSVFLNNIDISELTPRALIKKLDASFLIREKPKAKPKAKKKKKVVIKKPDLKKEVKAIEKPVIKKIVKKKVYGIRRVFAKGLGSGFGGGNAVVSKLGNTLEKEPDTIKASEEDLKGKLVSVTKITQMPKITKTVKPKYTDEMKANGIAGKVKAKVLVDVDGWAKKIIIIKDLGYGTREACIDAIKKMRFKPALRGKEPVAVWITFTFRFELQQ